MSTAVSELVRGAQLDEDDVVLVARPGFVLSRYYAAAPVRIRCDRPAGACAVAILTVAGEQTAVPIGAATVLTRIVAAGAPS